jgi:hypothetical protein
VSAAVFRIAGAVAALWGQGSPAPAAWTVTPSRPSVGDTVWLERRFTLPAGWRVRPGRLLSSDEVEALADPAVTRSGGDWVVRYAVAAWTPGPHSVTLPPVWRLGPEAQADSVLGGTATFALSSVIPDSVATPAPRPALTPLRSSPRDPRLPVLALVLAGGGLAAGIWWRRRPPRPLPDPDPPSSTTIAADRRWLDAGEAKAVAARAAGRLRVELARSVPEAHLGLSTRECLAVVGGRRPQAPVAELGTVLGALEQVAFADSADVDVASLARLAERLADRLGNGK